MHRFALLLVFILLVPVTTLGAQLVPHVAEYKVKISIASGELRTELIQTADGYRARHVLEPKGLAKLIASGSVAEVAEFAIEGSEVIPLRYQSDSTVNNDNEHARFRFDWQANEARGTFNDEDLVTALERLTHDRVSIQYALMHDLLNNDVPAQYRMFEPDKLRQVNVSLIGTRSVKVPAGRFEAIGIRHQAENSSRVMTLWCVEELGFLPVIIEQHRKGKLRVRAMLREYSPLSTQSD